jgi:hypothetical protein
MTLPPRRPPPEAPWPIYFQAVDGVAGTAVFAEQSGAHALTAPPINPEQQVGHANPEGQSLLTAQGVLLHRGMKQAQPPPNVVAHVQPFAPQGLLAQPCEQSQGAGLAANADASMVRRAGAVQATAAPAPIFLSALRLSIPPAVSSGMPQPPQQSTWS